MDTPYFTSPTPLRHWVNIKTNPATWALFHEGELFPKAEAIVVHQKDGKWVWKIPRRRILGWRTLVPEKTGIETSREKAQTAAEKELPPYIPQYTGYLSCQKCGHVHWVHGDCPVEKTLYPAPTSPGWYWVKDSIGRWTVVRCDWLDEKTLFVCYPRENTPYETWWRPINSVTDPWGPEAIFPTEALCSQFQEEVSTWAAETFPHQTPQSKIAHLRKEIEELAEAPDDGEEMADCFILLLNLAEMAGVNLMAEAQRKMGINRNRKWDEPDADGVCHHVAEPSSMFATVRPSHPLKVGGSSDSPPQAFVYETLKNLVAYAHRKTCLHEETFRGGAIWEICRDCGMKWADDAGGKPENAHEVPEAIKAAEDLLHKIKPTSGT